VEIGGSAYGGAAAHLAHASYAGRLDEEGRVVCRANASQWRRGLEEATWRQVNLGYLDYKTFDYAKLRDHADTLIVKDAGRDFFKIEI